MTHVDGDTIFISQEPPGKCELCGSVEETRPYGPCGKQVCFTCGMKDEKTAQEMFDRRMIGIENTEVSR